MLPAIKSGRLRAIAITSAKRSSLAPDLPTFAESGVPGYQSGTWYAIMAPTATPREIVSRLNDELVRAVQQPDVREKLHALGTDPVSYTPAQTHEFVRGEVERMMKVVKAAGIRLD
jgi:tripartite-type tricarboxylate transporter receptor subunit TctC